MIDARSLHNWLGAPYSFTDWLRKRSEEYGFAEDHDYFRFQKIRSETRGGQNRKDYLLTLDTAKELAMVERTDIGRDTRRYFIQMEKAAEPPHHHPRRDPVVRRG